MGFTNQLIPWNPRFSHYSSSLPIGLWSLQLDGVTNFGLEDAPLRSRQTWKKQQNLRVAVGSLGEAAELRTYWNRDFFKESCYGPKWIQMLDQYSSDQYMRIGKNETSIEV